MKLLILKLKFLIINFKQIVFLLCLFSFLLNPTNAFSDCKNDNLLTLDKLKQINIDPNNKRRWISNLFEMKHLMELNKNDFNINFYLDKKFKKRFKSSIEFIFFDGTSCKFSSRIRFHGDYPDHLKFKNGNLYSSVNVKLDNGNIEHITNFILFLPETREHDNEIFTSVLMNELGYLSPRTIYKDVKINGVLSKYIFQEYIGKEFLEHNSQVEAPIIEGHEVFEKNPGGKNSSTRLGQAILRPFLSRISNRNWIKGSNENFYSSLNALNTINLAYMSDPALKKKYALTGVLEINPKIFSKIENKKNNIFEAMMYALGSTHNLSRDDRRFYYDPIYDEFKNIYYDGGTVILNLNKVKPLILNYSEAEKATGQERKNLIWYPSVNYQAKLGARDAINLIERLDLKNFHKKLNKNGLNLNKAKIKQVLDFLVKRLEKIENAKVIEKNFVLEKSFYENYNKNFLLNDKLIFAQKNFRSIDIEICNFNLSSCKLYDKVSIELKKKIISQEKFDLNYNLDFSKNIFVGFDKEKYKSGQIERQSSGINKFKKIKIENQFLLATNKHAKIEIDYEKKLLKINNKDWRGRTVIYNSKVSGWNIKFNDDSNLENLTNEIVYNKDNLTGCLTIIDSNLINTKLYLENSKCEDSVNFIRSTGVIDEIEINNSLRDALDADFSEILFNKILINKSLNDCIDFSRGIYKVKFLNVNLCGDKGVSIGEKSKVKLDNVIIKSSNIGIASKDSSETSINNSLIDTTKYCVSAYNKKQEFFGSLVILKNNTCKNTLVMYDHDKLSSIKF